MDHNPANTSPQLAQHYGHHNLGPRPRQQSNATLDHNLPYGDRSDSPFANQQRSRPGLLRGHGTYSGTPSHHATQLYPVHLQSLAPASFPGQSQPARQEISPRITHQPAPIHVNRKTILPNHASPQGSPPQHRPHVSKQVTLPPSQGQYTSPQAMLPVSQPAQGQYGRTHHASSSVSLPSYTGPPPFEFIPKAPQSFLPPIDTEMAHPRQPPQAFPPAHGPRATQEPHQTHSPDYSNQPDLPSQAPGSAASDTDEAELALALALSEKMVVMEQEREEQLQKQEEEEFERALAQSMVETGSYGDAADFNFTDEDQIATSSKVKVDSPVWESGPPNRVEPAGSSSLSRLAHDFGGYNKSRTPELEGRSPSSETPATSGVSAVKQRASSTDEEAAPPYTQESGSSVVTSEKQPTTPQGTTASLVDELLPVLAQDRSDKVLHGEDATLSTLETINGNVASAKSPLHILRGSMDSLGGGIDTHPVYTHAPSEIGSSSAASTTSGSLSVDTGAVRSESPSELAYFNDEEDSTTPHPIPSPPPPFDFPSMPASLQPAVPGPLEHSMPTPLPFTHTSHINSATSSSSSNFMHHHNFPQSTTTPVSASSTTSRQVSPQKSYNPSPLDNHSSSLSLDQVSSNTSIAKSFQGMEAPIIKSPVPALPQGAAPAVPLVVNSNQYIDPDLLMGVTIDFKPPVLSPRLNPLSGPVPNIVSLPYGRAHPLHIQAPSWRHMLKLLTRMGNTKFERTENAKKAIQGDTKLRTVIQFIRVHPMGNDWRTILWFTLDHPVPTKLPNANTYINPHPNLFPWSYGLMDLPALLRDPSAVDSDMSKTYTIPATNSLPYPTLPLSFPNLGVYLQAALDFSREHKDDSTGYKKLAKMVQQCYPNTEEPSDEPAEKKTVGGLFKRVIGKNKKKTGKTNNEEVYELITPFVPDEWG